MPSTEPSTTSSKIREEVRQTIRQLNELAQSETDFDQFCDTVLQRVVKITGAYGALFWQIGGDNTVRLTHQTGKFPNAHAVELVSPDNAQHSSALVDAMNQQLPMGLDSETLMDQPPVDSDNDNNGSFLLLFAPVLNRNEQCWGTLELLQRGNVSPEAQNGYLRFLKQVSQLFLRWHERQDLTRLTANSDKWDQRLELISEFHKSIDLTETCYSIANESRRLLNCDRVSVGKWNGRRCKMVAISGQDRFDNRANVVRLLVEVATASVKADMPFWVTGETDGLAPAIAGKINAYLDESHSRTLAVIPLINRPPDSPDLEMKNRNKQKAKKLGVLVFEYFDTEVTLEEIEHDYQLIVSQAELAIENARKHGEIFLLPIWKRLGWLQKLLFQDHIAKTTTGLVCLAALTLLLIFCPKQLKMKVDGVMHPTVRQTIFAQTEGIVKEVFIDERQAVTQNQPLLRLENQDLDLQIESARFEIEALMHQVDDIQAQLSSAIDDEMQRSELGMTKSFLLKKRNTLMKSVELLSRKKEGQLVVSPIDGVVVTPQPHKYLDFPASNNLALLEVVDLAGDWQLELKIPQNKIAYVDQALANSDGNSLKVEFKIGTNPNLDLEGTLESVARRAVPSESGAPKYRAIVKIEPEQLEELKSELRSGAGATAKILCGKRSLGFVCFYQIYDFLRTKVFF